MSWIQKKLILILCVGMFAGFAVISPAAAAWTTPVLSFGGDPGWFTALDYYSVIPPTVKSITPKTGMNTGTVSITDLSGTGFSAGAQACLTLAGYPEIPAGGIRVVSSRKITGTFDLTGAQPGAWTVVVTNKNGGKGTLPGGFTVTGVPSGPAPSITGIVPAYGINTGTVAITDLQGTNFAAGATVTLKRSGSRDISATNVNVASPASITCLLNLNKAATGAWDVVVTNRDGRKATFNNGFTVYSTTQTARLTVNSIPAGATVDMDGSVLGTTNLTTRIPFGTHIVTVKKTGYKDFTTTVFLQGPGSSATVTTRLVKLSAPDADGDGTPDSSDGCPADRLKTAPGTCGCGVADTDSDHDSTPDCNDQCPNDAAKTAPGTCGCHVPDIDQDGDGWAACLEGCDHNPDLLVPGICGCDTPVDSDGDTWWDCRDQCPNDPAKGEPGTCGCGVVDNPTDSDGDSVPDCVDHCPNDPAKYEPGTCGCGVADTDSDHDSVPDCVDRCPNDPAKTAPGTCGCGVVDNPTDSDGDSVPDCNDQCPHDPAKIESGICGCRNPDIDTDGDGNLDCNDYCPYNPFLTSDGGECGCNATLANCGGGWDCVEYCHDDPMHYPDPCASCPP